MRWRSLKDKRFGKLVVLEYRIRKPFSVWLCRCDCGKEKEITAGNLSSGKTNSCGCLFKELWDKNKWTQTHGLSHTPIYNVWATMKARCSNPKSDSYKRYGGRGITVCERWNKFENFYEDMKDGYKKGLTLDRKNNDSGYEHLNCRWVTYREQANNTRKNHWITYKGKTKTISQWAQDLGLQSRVLNLRIVRHKWNIERALTTPLRVRSKAI